MRTPNSLLIAATLAAAVAATAHAGDPAKPAGFGKGKGALLSRDELRDCLARQVRIVEQSEAAVKAQAALDADKSELTRQEAALKDELATLDRTSAEAVDAYNAKAQARSKLVDDYNARSVAFNASVDGLQAERAGFSSRCDNRRYDEKDEMAVKNGK